MASVTPGSRIPFIAGNWKMNLDHLQAIAFVQKLAWSLVDAKHNFDEVEVGVFPPFTDLRSVQTLVAADKLPLSYGAQDMSEYECGAYTGEISAMFLSALECRYAIIGHSERRTLHGETDEQVALKAAAAVHHKLVPLICVGETADDLEEHGPRAVPVAQLEAALTRIATDANIVVAYEPVWAIGSGTPATPEQAENVAAALRAVIEKKCGANIAESTRILYGGSVKSSNIAAFMREPNIDGALVGGASLDVAEFSSIVRYQSHIGV
jgi:triosephosphate isomerase